MTVNPFAAMVNPFGTVSPRTFDPAVEYQFRVDNNGDAVADVTYATTFSPAVGGVQTLNMTRNGAAFATGNTGTNISTSGGGRLHAALFDDPFFFDLVGFNNNFNFTGTDTFKGADVSAIVLEVPSSDLGAQNVGIWARTLVGGNQADRMGRPAINTALIPSARKDEFNLGLPANDPANFGNRRSSTTSRLSMAVMQPTRPTRPECCCRMCSRSIPQMPADSLTAAGSLTMSSMPSSRILTNSPTPIGDGVNMNDRAFSSAFPYLASPNLIPEPSTIALLAAGLSAIGFASMSTFAIARMRRRNGSGAKR